MAATTNRVEIRNANPANEITSDCVIRAFVTATGDTYRKIQRQLGALAWRNDWRCAKMTALQATDFITRNGSMPHVWHKLAWQYGMRVVDVRNDGICFDPDWLPSNCIVSTHNHAVAIKDGKVVDTWDSIKRGTKRVQYIVVDAARYTDEADGYIAYSIIVTQEETRRLRRNAKAKAAREAKENAKTETREQRIARNLFRRVSVARR